jgi:hypothetical protein
VSGGHEEPVFVDTNVVIEAVRTGCWAAVSGGLNIQTVVACRREARSGDRSRDGYVAVSESHLKRIAAVRRVTEAHRAALIVSCPDAEGLDLGERDLLAYLHATDPPAGWRLCSPDLACMRVAVRLGWGDHLCSLERLVEEVGGRTSLSLLRQYSKRWLSERRTNLLLP